MRRSRWASEGAVEAFTSLFAADLLSWLTDEHTEQQFMQATDQFFWSFLTPSSVFR